MVAQNSAYPGQPRIVYCAPVGIEFTEGVWGRLPFDKLRDSDRGPFGGPGQEMKFSGRLDRGEDKTMLGPRMGLKYSFITR